MSESSALPLWKGYYNEESGLMAVLRAGRLLCKPSSGWGLEKLVEELAQRAAATEATTAERKLVLRETQEAADVFADRLAVSADEAAMLRRFERLQGVDSAFSHEFRALPIADRRIALELGEGAQQCCDYTEAWRAPGLAVLGRHRLAQSRSYGDFVVEGMAWLESDEALAALRGKLPADVARQSCARSGLNPCLQNWGRPEVVALWKSVVRRRSERVILEQVGCGT